MAKESGKNYITPGGLQRLIDKRRFLLTRERRAVTNVVAWAASNGESLKNADSHYCKPAPAGNPSANPAFLSKRIHPGLRGGTRKPPRGERPVTSGLSLGRTLPFMSKRPS